MHPPLRLSLAQTSIMPLGSLRASKPPCSQVLKMPVYKYFESGLMVSQRHLKIFPYHLIVD
jgi:hypothetical protein